MKQSIIQKSLLKNRTILAEGLLTGLVFWALIQLPVALGFFTYFRASEMTTLESQRGAIESILSRNFEQSARFGNLVYARGDILQQGKPFGLSDLGVCEGENELVPRPQ